ncbi:HEAT repeat-containing protein [Raineyella antarctica]|uniref:HEAT repeat-containing protein n=1 Tax=Raineyella antarctica TaxID=1577474 RepID=A0A1G6GF90_9ACTN|nr:HEAT repeat domain-containing protein [Raineyella antarctica]SDB80682.1 HEAT repeat-containing protein [Raineyella antarctica]
MTMSRETVLAALGPEEIGYPTVAALIGPGAIPILRDLVVDGDPVLAPKAAYLAGAITGQDRAMPAEVLEVAEVAAASPDPVVRIAGAVLAAQLGSDTAPLVLERLLDDQDPAVRKQALATAGQFLRVPAIRERLEERADREPVEELRETAHRFLQSESAHHSL